MAQYVQRYAKPQGPGDQRPTAMEIVEDLSLNGQLSDKVFVVTGVSSGIGIETMKAFAATGARVFGTVRNMENGQTVVEKVRESLPNGGEITLVHMEMDNLASVKQGAEEIMKQTKTVNVLVNNAGVMAAPEGKTVDGFETQFGTNHIGHFTLFQHLKPLLLASSTPSFPSRVVSLSSIGHRYGTIRPDDYNFTTPGTYDPWLAYGQSKTANIWFSNEIERRYGNRGLHSTSVHPGGIVTGLYAHISQEELVAAFTPALQLYNKNEAQGAATSVYAALSPEWKDKGGRYLSDCVEQGPVEGDPPLGEGGDGYKSWAYDEEGAKRLWVDSLRMVGLDNDDA